jgi:hypothetical protein
LRKPRFKPSSSALLKKKPSTGSVVGKAIGLEQLFSSYLITITDLLLDDCSAIVVRALAGQAGYLLMLV